VVALLEVVAGESATVVGRLHYHLLQAVTPAAIQHKLGFPPQKVAPKEFFQNIPFFLVFFIKKAI